MQEEGREGMEGQVEVSCVPGRFIRTSGVLSGILAIQSHVLSVFEHPLSGPT